MQNLRAIFVDLNANCLMFALRLELVAIDSFSNQFLNVRPFLFNFNVLVLHVYLVSEVKNVKLDHSVAIFDGFEQFYKLWPLRRLVNQDVCVLLNCRQRIHDLLGNTLVSERNHFVLGPFFL